jgi:ATP-dependent DNA ligase
LPDHPRRHNWADRYPWIVEAALKNRHRQFVIDGEAVVLGARFPANYGKRTVSARAARSVCASAISGNSGVGENPSSAGASTA